MPNVKVYGTPTCPFCVRVKEFLKSNNVEFEDIDISVNQDKVQELIQKSGQMGVPVLDIDGAIVVGFDKGKITEVLGL
ncbi:MAG: glutaredoxin domain-containing protein [Candidatus Omnitrophota bacterium]